MLNRRTFIAAASALAISNNELRKCLASGRVIDGGWREVPGVRQSFIQRHLRPLASHHDRHIRGDGQSKVVRLWKVWEQAAQQPFAPHLQDIGDCSGQASGLGVEFVNAVQVMRDKPEEWCGKQSTEVPYIAGRIEVGQSNLPPGARLPAEGVPVAWAVEALETIGSLPRAKYPDFDVSTYNPELAQKLARRGADGLPEEIEKLAAKYKLKAVNIDRGWPQACDFNSNGYPVVIGSSVGYFDEFDRDGFLLAGPLWMHAMLMVGFDTKSRRHGGCLAQSWGPDWARGPMHKYGCIRGGFWADARNIHKALMQGDSYALIEYDGPKKRRLDYHL